MVKLPFSGAFSQSVEILLLEDCCHLGLNELIKKDSLRACAFLTLTETLYRQLSTAYPPHSKPGLVCAMVLGQWLPRVGPGPAAPAAPGNWLRMQILRPHPKTSGVGPSLLGYKDPCAGIGSCAKGQSVRATGGREMELCWTFLFSPDGSQESGGR